ncbi:s1/P1 nuclease [Gregarina niphandrodes]|uniref:S1/P1 nuclease n=1 Tax=Gregarina niphandrodes TaxID=110365 RepID=A0A023B580_GRENI|nr:s1/P1 nuclease [Gregarina niphandrodes]EZG59050.1 s1/P1 nuclease [Gregarina niphandrodes]|eukprot:XP_011130916.1 s1/P1 nuclease [Gregarina niphandrodes]
MKILAVCFVGALGWWDGGHTLVAAVAKRLLEQGGASDVIATVDNMLLREASVWADYSSLPRVATWADKIKETTSERCEGETRCDGNGVFSNIHFVDQPIRLYGPDEQFEEATWTSLQETLLHNVSYVNGYTTLNEAMKVVINPDGGVLDANRGTLWSQDLAVRLITHLVGDLHQPLHGIALFDPALCGATDDTVPCTQNDAGGNGIGLDWTNVKNYKAMADSINLHGLWDSMCQYAQWDATDLTLDQIDDEADKLIARFPTQFFKDKKVDLGWDWETGTETVLHEDLLIATSGRVEDQQIKFGENDHARLYPSTMLVSTPNSDGKKNLTLALTDEYIDWCSELSQERVTLGGYRLAAVLKQIAVSRPDELAFEPASASHATSTVALTVLALTMTTVAAL